MLVQERYLQVEGSTPQKVGPVHEGRVALEMERDQCPGRVICYCYSGGFKLVWQLGLKAIVWQMEPEVEVNVRGQLGASQGARKV